MRGREGKEKGRAMRRGGKGGEGEVGRGVAHIASALRSASGPCRSRSRRGNRQKIIRFSQ